ncbi:MAG TPA: hypothetical protein VFI95_15425 [Terriglobales bacterium]|nr:hypothetical protein [Terriglobales bacterium]
MRNFTFVSSVLLLSASLLAQSSPQQVSEVHLFTPKPGMTTQWEAGRKQHSAFHVAQKDTWNVLVWQILTGERTGDYIAASPGLKWKDLDDREAFNKKDLPDVAKNMQPYTASTSTAYYVYRDDLSLTKPPATPAKMRTTTAYTLIPEHTNDFIDAVKKINEAIQKTNYPVKPSRWYMLANGGSAPTFVLVSDRASWADMEPPEKKLDDMLKEAYGDSGPQVLDQLRKSCRSIVSEMSLFRPDLSYIPK